MALPGNKIARVRTGPPNLVERLNELIDRANEMRTITGDGRYILVNHVGGNVGIRWNGPPIITGDEFDAVITGNASLATNRWKYAWSEVRRDGDVWSTFSEGRSGTTTTDYAVNMLEVYHTATYAWGVDVTGADYPAGMAPRPVGGGGAANTHRYNVVVRMRRVIDVSGVAKYQFSAPGSHDGTCS